MSIMECEHLEAVYSMEESSNHSLISARCIDPSSILTQVPVSATDFEAYVVNCIGEVTFSYKELRIILSFCELVSPLIRIYCDKPGKPVIFACAHETRLSGRFVLATLPFDSQSTTNSQGSQSMLHPSCLVNKTPVQLKSNKEFAQESSMMMENSHSGFQLISKNKDVVVPFGLSATSEMANSDAILTNSKTPTTPQLIESDFNFICKRKSQNSLSSASSFLACDLDDTLLVSPPIKKFRSVLLSHDDDDDDGGCVLNETSDLDGLSENDDRHAVIPNAQVSCPNQFPAMLSRTVLVVDSDGEN